MEVVGNRTGRWFVGVFALNKGLDVNATAPETMTCEENNFDKDSFASAEDFGPSSYLFQTYTGGCYYFNRSSEVWESIGVTVRGTKEDNTLRNNKLGTVLDVQHVQAGELLRHEPSFFVRLRLVPRGEHHRL